MLGDADLQSDEYRQISKLLQEQRTAQVVTLDTESLGSADSNVVRQAIQDYDKSRQIIAELDSSNTLSDEAIALINPDVVFQMTAEEKGRVVSALLKNGVDSQEVYPLQIVVASMSRVPITDTQQQNFFSALEHRSNLIQLISLAQSDGMAEMLSQSFVHDLLMELAAGLDNSRLRDHYLDPSMSDKERLELLQYLSSEQRLQALDEILGAARFDSRVSAFLRDKIDNFLFHLSPDEKRHAILSESERGGRYIAQILRSSQTLEELNQIISSEVEQAILSNGNRESKELVALARIQESFRWRFELYRDYEQRLQAMNPSEAAELLENLIQGFIRALDHSPYSNSKAAKDLRHALTSDLDMIAVGLEEANQDPQKIREMLRVQFLILELELFYGVNIDYGSSSGSLREDSEAALCEYGEFGIDAHEAYLESESRSSEQVRWRYEDIKDIERLLKALPEGQLLFTPMLRDIELVSSLGRGILGARYHADGKIKIAHVTRDNRWIENSYQGLSSLLMVLAHEVGHSFQIANGPVGLDIRNLTWGEGAAEFDFDEWLTLSGWRIYERSRVSSGSSTNSVMLDGVEYPLGVAVEIDGERLVLSYNRYFGLLTAYSADADFSRDPYARSDPGEDFAEAFAEYLFLPQRLIEDAPLKFLHLERELRLYSNDFGILELLRRSLERQ